MGSGSGPLPASQAAALATRLDDRLADADARLLSLYPGDRGRRQPIHTVYVPADRMHAAIGRDWGDQARGLLAEHAPEGPTLAAVTGLATRLDSGGLTNLYDRVLAKLEREPVEDLRVDFEDGYGHRPDDEEDAAAAAAAKALGAAMSAPDGPWSGGIRFKSFEALTRRRGLRTLEIVLGGLLETGELPTGFVVTLPKVSFVDQVEAMVEVCETLEAAYDLPAGRLLFEIQIETPPSVLAADGAAAVARMVHAAAGRCTGLHYGAYDYSAALGIAAAYQSMEHPVADHAKAVMQLAAAGTGVWVSDGSTNVVPVGDRAAVQAAWALHARLVRRSLERGLYQGWDMHPGHLATRYLATYAFFREGLDAAAARLRAYLSRVEGAVMDEPATAQALAAAVVRGLDCGAVDEGEVVAGTGLDRAGLDRLVHRRAADAAPASTGEGR